MMDSLEIVAKLSDVAFDHADAPPIESMMPFARLRRAKQIDRDRVAVAVVQTPAVAPRGSRALRRGLRHGDGFPRHRPSAGNAEAREARTGHRRVTVARDRSCRCPGKGRRAVLSIGDSQTTSGKPPISAIEV